MVKRHSSVYTCSNCEYQVRKWVGKCSECGEWNSFVIKEYNSINDDLILPKKINQINIENYQRYSTGLEEFDRVTGGGLISGSLTLIGGEPGIGKSTLLTKVLSNLSKTFIEENILYISGEESESQVAQRAKRLGVDKNSFYILNEVSFEKIKQHIKKLKPKFLVIDSIQTTITENSTSPAGSLSQVREVTHELMKFVKAEGITCFIIGHITKEGNIAGPKVLEHMVDTVIYFEGDQFGHYRVLRAIKNRFGCTNEIGLFEMRSDGLSEIRNPSQYFLDDVSEDSYGRAITLVKEGSRNLFLEVQSLVSENRMANGRRIAQGIDSGRISMLVAVIEKYLGIPIGQNDIYINLIGNMKVKDNEIDLAVIASLVSSYNRKFYGKGILFLGEVGLTGEVRGVTKIEEKLKEIKLMKYKKLVTTSKIAKKLKNELDIEIIGIKKVKDLLELI